MIAYKLITTKKYPKQLPICKTKVGVFTPIKLAGLVQMLSTTYYLKRVTKRAHCLQLKVDALTLNLEPTPSIVRIQV